MKSVKIFSRSPFSILWWSGTLSSFGDWATLFASVALASYLGATDGNSELTAVVPVVARIIPAFMSSFAGLLADRFNKKNVMIISDLVRMVVNTDEGTAKFANVPNYEIGGKTGTADKVFDGVYSEGKINTFASIFPTSKPKFVFVVMLDDPKKSKDYYYKYRHRDGGWKGTYKNSAGWTSVEVAGKVIDKRMDYTMIGDGVNLAARLESACKQYNAKILISEYTFKKLRGTYKIRHIDDVIVKGKTEPVGVFEVLDYHDKRSFPGLMDVIGHFQEGREHYRGGNFEKAIKSFETCLKINKNDLLSQMYLDRCNKLKNNKNTHWKGIWVMDSK